MFVPDRTRPIVENISNETAQPLAFRLDDSVADTLFLGYALPNTQSNENKWRIKKIDTSAGLIITWADGNSNFDNVWDNRATLTYS